MVFKSSSYLLILVMLLILMPGAPVGSQSQNSTAIRAYERGLLLFDQDFLLEAIRSFQDAISLNPNYSDAHREVARGFYYLDEYDEALVYINRALNLAPNDSRNRSLCGRILITLGRLEEAEAIFTDILRSEPFNNSARVGLGELSLADGDIITAGSFFEDSNSINPGDRRVLLALAFIYQDRRDFAGAERFLQAAIEADSLNPRVHFHAAEFYALSGDYETARFHAITALNLDEDYYPALEILSRILADQGEYRESLAVLNQLDFTRLADPQLLYYTKALAEYQTGESGAAINSLSRALRGNPDDEMSRLLLEEILLDYYVDDLQNPMRAGFAEYHFQRAGEFIERNRFDSALYHMYRGLTLAPLSESGRRGFADLLRERGEYARYVNELQFIQDQLMIDDRQLSDDLEIYRDILRDTAASRWDVDQFLIERELTRLGFFTIDEDARTLHGHAEDLLGKHVMDQLFISGRIEFLRPAGIGELSYDVVEVISPSRAFEQARRNSLDYYILYQIEEGEESLEIQATLHLGRTGRPLRQYAVVRSGVTRVKDAVMEISIQILDSLPLRARLMRRNFERGLINIGYQDGIEDGDELLILKPADLRLYTEDSMYDYSPEDIIGRAVVTATDFLVSQVRMDHEGFFYRISRGDFLIPAGEEESDAGESDAGDQTPQSSRPGLPASIGELYERIRQIR